jgi:hypothetical protein
VANSLKKFVISKKADIVGKLMSWLMKETSCDIVPLIKDKLNNNVYLMLSDMLAEGECRPGSSLDIYRSNYCLFTFHLSTAGGQLLSDNYLMDSPV